MPLTKKSKMTTNKPNVTVTVYLFKLDGCGHCEALKPIWNNVVKSFKNKDNIQFKEVESEEIKDLPKEINKLIEAETIVGYPDMRLLTSSGKVSKFEGGRTESEISKWITSTSGGSKRGGCGSCLLGGRRRKNKRNLRKTIKLTLKRLSKFFSRKNKKH
jgi:thiol-disulfide isomerase/thioredoxin